jgi:type 1 glutamine amidotransferase
MPFSEMVGGSFDYHPPQQEVTLELADTDHPLVKAFEGKSFVHVDEPYLFNKAYAKKDFHPLLYMDTDKLTGKKKPIEENIRYVSWIKKHGKGRVFYVSPSHNAQSFEDVRMLKFFLDGTQYVLGDLKCDDSVAKL